jgi:glycosyltransferase involved in cell wall biosynthesis
MSATKIYDHESLEGDSLGGTEQTIIRVAEGLASKGHSVIVLENKSFQPVTSPNGVMYVPWEWLSQLQPRVCIHLRTRLFVELFKDCKQYIWMHDATYKNANNIEDWHTYVNHLDVEFIAVSDWHVQNILEANPNLKVRRIYTPIGEEFLNYPRPKTYDKNQLVWMSSPHKGLDVALDLFPKLLEMNPEFKLVVFNPGYYKQPNIRYPRVRYLTECSRVNMRSIISQSLAVFFPTRFEETLGMFAMEANALGCPVACMKIAALAESCNNQFAKDEDGVLDLVADWYYNGRPSTSVSDKFKFENIYPSWKSLLL